MNETAFVEVFEGTHADLLESVEILGPKRVSVVVNREGFLNVARSLKKDFGLTYPVSGGGC